MSNLFGFGNRVSEWKISYAFSLDRSKGRFDLVFGFSFCLLSLFSFCVSDWYIFVIIFSFGFSPYSDISIDICNYRTWNFQITVLSSESAGFSSIRISWKKTYTYIRRISLRKELTLFLLCLHSFLTSLKGCSVISITFAGAAPSDELPCEAKQHDYE